MTDVLIIGGGPAGLTAAIAAARAGANAVILERMDRAGKKILVTGNGRCNLTNTDDDPTRYHGLHPEFASEVGRRFPPSRAREFFGELGLLTVIEPGGLVYPACGQASAVLDVLRMEIDRLGVEVRVGTEVARLARSQTSFEARAIDSRTITADHVILATGGRASPVHGSNGSGWDLARSLGHSIVEPFPALVPLNISAPFLKAADGVRVRGSVALWVGETVARRETGEVLFTAEGLSGIAVMQLSRRAGEALAAKRPASLQISLLDRPVVEITSGLETRFRRNPGRSAESALVGLVHKRLILPLLRAAGVHDSRRACSVVSSEDIQRLAALLTDWRFPVTGTLGWARAQVSAGGVETSEIDSSRMESKIVPNLFFAGEVVDVDGDCGGYNLGFAWASGFVAGTAAAGGDPSCCD